MSFFPPFRTPARRRAFFGWTPRRERPPLWRRTFSTMRRSAMIEVALAVSPGFQMMIFAALSVFEVANIAAGETLYDIQVLSEQGGPVQSSLGMPIETRAFSRPMFDTLVVGGLIDVKPPVP